MGGFLDWQNIAYLADELAVPPGNLGPLAKPKRAASIAEAIGFSAGASLTEKQYTPLYGPFEGLWVAVGKPGKETDPKRKKPNPNDMTPSLLRDGTDTSYRPTFGQIFAAVQRFASDAEGAGESALQVLGALFFRNAYMLDHKQTESGVWRYEPPEQAVRHLESVSPTIDDVPVRAFLYPTETLALNEDVKYNPPGARIGETGRQNNLLTYAHMTAVFLNLVSVAKFTDGIIQARGVSALGQREGIELFGLLQGPDICSMSDLETEILGRLEPWVGRSLSDLARASQVAVPDPGYKGRVAYVLKHLLGAVLDPHQSAWLQVIFNLKTIRVGAEGRAAEDISFPAIRQDEVITQTWGTSELRRLWQRRFLIAVFREDDMGNETLLGMAFCSIPTDDLETRARDTWRSTIRSLKRGERSALPKRRESPFFVRNHSSRTVLVPGGKSITPIAFWLSRY